MVTDSRVRVLVEIERTAATVSGQTCIGQTAAVGFYGWLELIAQLESALGQPNGAEPADFKTTDAKEPEGLCDT